MSDKQPIAVVCAANAIYAIPTAVMLTSVVCNSKTNRDLNIYIIESDFSTELRKKIEASLLQNKKGSYRLGIHWIKLDPSLVKDLPGAGDVEHITSETYGKVLAPDLLPATCQRVVSLDSDLVVLADPADLFDALDDRHTVAAVSNVFFPYVSSPYLYERETIVFNYAELGIPATNRYFQAGVLVINLNLWRERKITSRIIHYLESHKEKVLFHDQGGLNAILHDQWLELDLRWNQTTMALYPEYWKSPAYSKKDWLKTKNEPFIVHYTGRDKPWNPGFNRPRSSFFYRYLKKTLFRQDLKVPAWEYAIGYRNYYLLWRAKKMIGSILSKSKIADSKRDL
jgi:lipopolysaccharide biosynthesis glycosyltransferase